MRARLSFALTTLTLLFLLQGLSALLGVVFALVSQGIFPALDLRWLMLALVPVAALFASALPFSLWVERSSLLVGAAVVAASARVFLTLPALPARLCASAVVVAAGAIFLGKAVGFLEGRTVAAGAATAVVLDGLLRLAGWSYDVSLRPWWLPVQLVVSAAAVGLALMWKRLPLEEQPAHTLERRAGGVRLRGAIALGCILFLQVNILARAEVAYRLLGVSYAAASVTLIGAGGLAVLLLLGARGPVGTHRWVAILLAILTAAGALAPRLERGSPGWLLLLFATGHAAGLLLLDSALVPATGRRRGWRLAAGMGTFFLLTCAWTLTFYYAFTLPAFEGRTGAVIAAAAVLLILALALTPRPVPSAAALERLRPAALALIALLVVAGVLARPPGLAAPAVTPTSPRVATFNIHYGFSEDWRYDPERIARTIEEAGASVVALQEVTAGMMTAYGTDLTLWLERRLRMRALFAPSINGLLGDVLLTQLPVLSFATQLLPPRGADRKILTHAALAANRDTLSLYATHFGITGSEQRVQVAAILETVGNDGRAIILGDLNAEPNSEVVEKLRDAGFRDVFDAAGRSGGPTWPAERPLKRIDWIWVRGYRVLDAVVSRGAGSDHRLVTARLRPD